MEASILLEALELMPSFPHPCGRQLEGTGCRGRNAVHLYPLSHGSGGVEDLSIPEGTAACHAHRNSILA